MTATSYLPVSLSLILSVLACSALPGAQSPAVPVRTCNAGRLNACQPPIAGVDCAMGTGCGELQWNAWGPIPWQAFGQGEYVGPARSAACTRIPHSCR